MDYTQFAKALARFKEMLDLYNQHDRPQDGLLLDAIRESLAKRFEYTLEIAWKTCKRHLFEQGFAEAATGSPKAIMRLAFSNALVPDVQAWLGYIDARQSTSHDYAEDKLDRVLSCCDSFFRDASDLYEKMTGSRYDQ